MIVIKYVNRIYSMHYDEVEFLIVNSFQKLLIVIIIRVY